MRKKLLSLLTLLLCAVTGAWAAEVEVNTKTGTGGTGTWSASSGSVTGSVTVTGVGTISFSLPKDADNNAVGSSYLTWKKNAVMTMTMPDGYNISAVKFTFSAQDKGPANSSKNSGDINKNMTCSLGSLSSVGESTTVFSASGTPTQSVTAKNTMGAEFRLTQIVITYSAAGPSISAFTPATGSKVKTGATVKIDGSTGTTVYYAWSASALTASEVVTSGTSGTADAATVTTSGIASSKTTLYAVAKKGEDVSDLATATYTIDDTAPTLSSSTPADGDTDVSVDGTIALTFDESIATVDDTKFSLSTGTISGVAIDGTDDNVVNVTYTGLPSATAVTLSVAADAVADEAGNKSAALSNITFTTVANYAPTTVTITPSPSGSVAMGTTVTLTASSDGLPVPNFQWYSCTATDKTGAAAIDGETSDTYTPSTATAGTYYYFVEATNSEGAEQSGVYTLNVFNPNHYVDGNAYYVAADDYAANGVKIYADNITAELVAGGSLNNGATEGNLSSLNSNFVALITSSSSDSNGWGPKFTSDTNGILTVGVKIGNGKTFSITNVTDFKRQATGEAEPTANGGTSWKTSADTYALITIDVVAGTEYEFSVAGSKMGFYGFEFTPTVAVSTLSGRSYASCVTSKKLDFSAADGITAYIATGLNGSSSGVVLSSVDIVPAGTPIIVKTETQGATVNVPVTTADASNVSANKLVAGDGTTAWNGTTGTTYYYLASDQFHEATDGTLQSGKAYLAVTSGGGAPELNIIVDGENSDDITTGIDTIEHSTLNIEHSEVYNLNGQRVAQPTKGLYIVNGKKVVVK